MEKEYLEYLFNKEISKVISGKELWLKVNASLIKRDVPQTLFFDVSISDMSVGISEIVRVKINKYRGWKYSLSHHYHGTKQATPYYPGIEGVPQKDIDSAFHYAAIALFSFYEKKDKKEKRWVKNRYFKG